jgi:hypothetical protein
MFAKLRLLLAAVVTLSLAMVGGTSAQASVNHGPTLVSATANLERMIPLDDGRSLLIWRDGSGQVNRLVSSVVNLDGTIEPSVNIYMPDLPASVRLAATDAWTKLPDGSIALTWMTRYEDGQTLSTSVMVAITDDGSFWNTPTVVSSSNIDLLSNDSVDCPFCGHENPQIASDGFGRLAIQFAYSSGIRQDWAQALTTSVDGQNWKPVDWKTTESSYIFGATIIGLPTGGFIASWVANWAGQFMNRYATRSNGSITGVWQDPIAVASHDQLNYGGQLLLTSPTEVALVYVDGPNMEVRYAVEARRFSLVTKKWSPEQRLFVSGAADYLTGDLVTAVAPDGTVAAAVVSELSSADTIHFNTFKGSRVFEASTPLTQNSSGLGLHKIIPNPSGSFSLVYSSGTAGVRIFTPGDSTGNVDVPFDSGVAGEVQVAVSASGNAFIGSNINNVAKFVAIERASAPVTSGAGPSIVGKAKTGVTLKSSIVGFKSISGVGANAFQWYACSRAVAPNTTILPDGCVAIAKATAATFKVTSKQKGKYLSVAVKNTNSVGTITLFAPATTKSK